MIDTLIPQFGVVGTALVVGLAVLVAAYVLKKVFDLLIALIAIGVVIGLVVMNSASFTGDSTLPGPLDRLLQGVGLGSGDSAHAQCVARAIGAAQAASGPAQQALHRAGQACTAASSTRLQVCERDLEAGWLRWVVYDKAAYCQREERVALAACHERALQAGDDAALRGACGGPPLSEPEPVDGRGALTRLWAWFLGQR